MIDKKANTVDEELVLGGMDMKKPKRVSLGLGC